MRARDTTGARLTLWPRQRKALARGRKLDECAQESLLVNFVYCHPVGHAVEALQACLGYRRADPDRRIGLVLKANTAVELARWCEFVDDVYTVDVDVFTPPADDVLDHVPRAWDRVVDEPRGHQPWQRDLFPGLAGYYALAERHFRTRRGHGVIGEAAVNYQPGHRLELTPPGPARAWAEALLPERDRGPTIALLPAGSAERWRYPSLASWLRIVDALIARWPDARLCLVGKLASDERTSTGFTGDEFDALAAAAGEVTWAVDVPLAHQLAALRRCDLLISPHTGFAFAGMAAGTPWLALAGNDWAEYYFNPGVPFYSVLPDIDRYPCYVLLGNTPEPVADDGPRSPSMSAPRIEADLGELLDGAAWLLEGDADFNTAMRSHFTRLHRLFRGRTDLMFSVDDLHLAYVPADS